MTQSLNEFVESLYTAAEESGLRRSPVHFDCRNVPETAVTDSFTISIQSANTRDYRDNPLIRIEHVVTVGMLFRVYPDQARTIQTHLDAEELLMAALLLPSNLPGCHVTYLSTRRQQIASLEKMVVEMTFSAKADWDFSSIA